MALIDDVKAVCSRLADTGWANLLHKHGLNIEAADLARELERELDVDRDVPGFEDFAAEGRRGIEPGMPARSLLFHALASPNVVAVDGKPLGDFPTLAEITAVENYVYGARPPSVQELSALAGGKPMAIVVFATEYRSAVDTVHRKHADMCYARTGIARVGNTGPEYDAQARGFIPFVDGNDFGIRVLPARYAAYVAVQQSGEESSFGPMRFSFMARHPEIFRDDADGEADPGDENRKFWVPVHKIFTGECIRGRGSIEVDFDAHHVNEKIRRIHLQLARLGHETGWARPDIDQPPFRFGSGIAAFSSAKEFGVGVLVPEPHDPLVQEATYNGQRLTFVVPAIEKNEWAPSLLIESGPGRQRHAPEYVHVRHVPGAATPNLNDLATVADVVRKGGYRAQHYVDFTADGWIAPVCPDLNIDFPRLIPAYSLVTAPDFYFNCDQRELMDWWLERAPGRLRNFLWETSPLTLADERRAPNLKLNNIDFAAGDPAEPRAGFSGDDDTVTAIVSSALRGQRQQRPLSSPPRDRHSPLPDAASGVFAPGWDVSYDHSEGIDHLAAYGLGSPFPEDSKLCAALSTFWPAVAPDAGRQFGPLDRQDPTDILPTVSPMTDDELGLGQDPAWDGVVGPRLVLKANGTPVVEYSDFSHIDYVENALQSKFTLKMTSQIDFHRYTSRVLAMSRAYLAVGVPINDPSKKSRWNILSFREVPSADPELRRAERQSGGKLSGQVFRFEMFRPTAVARQPKDFRKVHVGVARLTTVFVGATQLALVASKGGKWRKHNVGV